MSGINGLIPEVAKELGLDYMPANGSGVIIILQYLRSHIPEDAWRDRIPFLGSQLPNICGGYPLDDKYEHGVNTMLTVVLFVLAIGALVIFSVGYKRGHFFYPMLLIFIYCTFTGGGYICRLRWAADLSNIPIGMTSLVLGQMAEYLLVLCNLIFAHRICLWRRPRATFSATNFMFYGFYLMGLISFLFTIIGQLVPFYQFLTVAGSNTMSSMLMAGSILEVIFAMLPFPLVYLSAVFASNEKIWGKKALSDPVYQADWIDNAHIFSYPIPIHRTVNKTHFPIVTRVIPTYEIPAGGEARCLSKPMLPGSPSILLASFIVIVTSCAQITAPVVRTLSTQIAKSANTQYIISYDPVEMGHNYFPQSPPAMWVFFGGIPMCVVLCWLLLRVDLRFYIPPIYWRESDEKNPKLQHIYEALS